MIKAVGSLLIFMGFGVIWAGELRRWQRQSETVTALLGALEDLADRIRLTRTPLPRLLRELGLARRGAVGAWMQEIAAALERGEAVRTAWTAACRSLPIEEETRKILVELGYKLSGDEDSICKAISLVRRRLTEDLSEKRKGRRDRERQATALCFSGAALLVILLL